MSQPESFWREEVEKVEKLLQVVLQRSSCQQQFVLQWVVVQDAEKLKREITKQTWGLIILLVTSKCLTMMG